MKFSRIIAMSFIAVLMMILVACGTQDQITNVEQAENTGESESTEETENTEEKIVLKMGGIQSVDDSSTKAMNKMADIVDKKTNGRVEIQVFPASQLGDAVSQMEAVQFGSIDFFVDAGGWVSKFVPDKGVESLFFVFGSEDHYRKFLSSDLNKELEGQFTQETGIKIVANNWLRAPRVIVSKKPVKQMSDLEGLKMRVPDILTYLESVQALGARPTQVPWGEVYLALNQGVVEAAEGPLDAVYTMKFYESANNITMTNHIRDDMVVMINNKKFNSLTKEQQDIIVAAANEAGDWYTQTVKDNTTKFIDEMKKAGVNFIEVDKDPFIEKMVKTASQLENEDLWRKGLFEEIQQMK